MTSPNTTPKCAFCGQYENLSNDLGFSLCADCRPKYRVYKCERCGNEWVQGIAVAHMNLCSDCVLRDLVGTLDPQKLDIVREQMRLVSKFRAIVEAREQFDISLRQAVDIVYFLEKEESLNNSSTDNKS